MGAMALFGSFLLQVWVLEHLRFVIVLWVSPLSQDLLGWRPRHEGTQKHSKADTELWGPGEQPFLP